jgi:GNAT superfamily N-acetyltransferase
MKASGSFGDDRPMLVDREWLRSVSETIAEVDGGDLKLLPVMHQGEPPRGIPDYFLRRPHFAVGRRGTRVGQFETAIVDAEGRPKLAIRKLIIKPEAQGLGVARTIQKHLEARLPHLGIDRITLDASGSGSYAWARLGYDFDTDAYKKMGRFAKVPPSELPNRIRSDLLKGPSPHEWGIPPEYGGGTAPASAPDSAAQMLHALASSGKRGEDLVADLNLLILGEAGSIPPSADEIASFGRGTEEADLPAKSWIGRELMIRANWSGIRKMTR